METETACPGRGGAREEMLGAWRGTPPSSWGLRGRRGPRRTGTGMAVRLVRRGCSSIFAASPSPPASPCSASRGDRLGREPPGSPAPRWAFEEPRGGSQSLRRGEAGWRGREGTGFREGAGWERRGPDQRGIPQDSCRLPWDSAQRRPRAHTRAQRPARPRSALRLQAASLPRLHAHRPHAHTPDSRAHRTFRAVRARPRPPEAHTHVCTDSRPRTPRSRGHRAAPAAQTLHTRHSLPPPPRVFTPTPRSVTGGGRDARLQDSRRWAPSRPVSPCAPQPGSPACGPRRPARPPRARAPARSAPHSLSAPMRLRLRLWPGLPCGLAGAGEAAEAAAGAERAGAGAETPLLPPEDPLLPCLTPPAPRFPMCLALASGSALRSPLPEVAQPPKPSPSREVSGRGAREGSPLGQAWNLRLGPWYCPVGQPVWPAARPQLGHQPAHFSGPAPR